MAKRGRVLVGWRLWPGLLAATLIVGAAALSFAALWFYAPSGDGFRQTVSDLYHDRYLWHVVLFTFMQAALSAVLSIVPALFVALAFYRRIFPGRSIILKLYAMTLVLPVLVAVFGLLSVYGAQGWLSRLFALFNVEYSFSLYGLHGILLAHVFFNLPLAVRLLLQTLDNIAPEQRQLAAQLGMNALQRFRFVEWPALKRQIAPTSALIFMLCFASFAAVLALGGGPKATTLELAIYQALRYDFDLTRAALMALIQLFFCLGLMLLSLRINSTLPVGISYNFYWRDPADGKWLKFIDGCLIACAVLFIVPPLIAVAADGINRSTLAVLQEPKLWRAIATSVKIALGSALVGVTLTMMLLWTSRELSAEGQPRWARRLELCGMTILAMPAIVLATGFFLLFINSFGLPQSPALLIILINGLMAIPYTLKLLTMPMYDLAQRYSLLSRSLGVSGWNRLKLVELAALKRPLAQALAFACVLSIGDFGVIALFGNDSFLTLPYYLYEQLGAYRSEGGAVTALILLILCFILFAVIERLAGKHDKP